MSMHFVTDDWQWNTTRNTGARIDEAHRQPVDKVGCVQTRNLKFSRHFYKESFFLGINFRKTSKNRNYLKKMKSRVLIKLMYSYEFFVKYLDIGFVLQFSFCVELMYKIPPLFCFRTAT